MKLNRTDTSHLGHWWWTVDRYTLTAVIMLISIGMVLVMAASPAVAERIGVNSFFFVHHQIVFLLLGIITMFIFSLMPLVVLRRFAALCFVCCILLLIVVLVFGSDAKGAKRWIYLFGISIQPSEFVKPFFIVVTAWILARRNVFDNFPGFRISLLMYILVAGLLILQPDLGMTVIVSLVWGGQMIIAGLPVMWIGIAVVSGVVGIVSAYTLFSHVANRINIFFDPSSGDNYQVAKSLEAFINGGIFGRGPGEGIVKEHIPDSHTDFIFAVAGEELGIVVCILIVAIFGFIVIRGFYRIYNEKNLFVIFAASGLLMEFGIQTLVNMGVALNMLPNTGMTLPFISYGGSSTLGISITIGMLLAFTRKRYGRDYSL